MDAIELTLFNRRCQAVCDEMGAVLQRTAFSPNIKDRLDFSCAIFDIHGQLCAQAAHIPVHLGSMAYAMADIVQKVEWQDGDMLIINDPYLGGTHLPDITLIAPIFFDKTLCAFVANRAHHADIGASTPGSMPLANTLQEEGLIIPPTLFMQNNEIIHDTFDGILENINQPENAAADFKSQMSANFCGKRRLFELINNMTIKQFHIALEGLNHYAEILARSSLKEIPDGQYTFTDVMDDDGQGNQDILIKVTLDVNDGNIHADFTGTASQVKGNINCPLSVAAAAVYYCFYCLMPPQTPACAGSFRSIKLKAPKGCLINANYPAAVAAGNVETSTRLVDVVLGALAKALPEKIPAASHGSMNNIAMGHHAMGANTTSLQWDYYETLAGGMGAGANGAGLSAVQTHMTNTLNTPIEVLEKYYPIRITRYAIRQNSGGKGRHDGGNGLIREYEFLQTTSVTLLTERRTHAPWGLSGGGQGQTGMNLINDIAIPAKSTNTLQKGDRLTICTAGGGAWGYPTLGNPGNE